MIFMLIILGIVLAVLLLFIYCACVVASKRGDENYEL